MNALTLNMTTTTPSTPAPTVGDNSENRMSVILGSMRDLGKSEAAGVTARPTAGLRICEAAANGDIDERDVEPLFDAYIKATNTLAGRNPLAVEVNKDSRKAQVSKFRAFIKMGMLPSVDGLDTLKRAAVLSRDIRAAEGKAKAPYVALLAVIAEQLRRPTENLTDDEISAIVAKDEPAEKDLIRKLQDAYKVAVKLHDMAQASGTAAAVDGLADAIADLGGDLPPITKSEKDKAAFLAKAAKFGAQVTF